MSFSGTTDSRLISVSRKWNSAPSLCNIAYGRNEETHDNGQELKGNLCHKQDKPEPGKKRHKTRETIKKMLSFWRIRSDADAQECFENANSYFNSEHSSGSALESWVSKNENGSLPKEFLSWGKCEKQHLVDLTECNNCSATKIPRKTTEKFELKRRTPSMQMLDSAEYRRTQKPFDNIIKSFKAEQPTLNGGVLRVKRNFNKSQLTFDKSECSSISESKDIEDELSLEFLMQFKQRLKLLRNSKSLNKIVPSNVFSKVINYYFANKSST